MKKLLEIIILSFFVCNLCLASTNNFKLKCKIDWSTEKKIKWYQFKEKIFLNFENNRLLSAGSKIDMLTGYPAFENEIDWMASFRKDLEKGTPYEFFAEGIFASGYYQIISYEIRLNKSDNFGYISIKTTSLKEEAFIDWQRGNDPSFKYFNNWLENYSIEKEKLLRSNPSKYAFIPSFLPYDQQLKMLENKILTTDILRPWKDIDYNNGECVFL